MICNSENLINMLLCGILNYIGEGTNVNDHLL
jgi:hypothetical protein